MTTDFDSYLVEWYNGIGTWEDITDDIIYPVQGSRGISGTGLGDRIAGIGTLTFSLKNDASNTAGLVGYYTPGHTNCISVNWGKPYFYPIRITITYEDRTKVLWYGTFEPGPNGVVVDPFETGRRKVRVSFRDWMGLAQERKLNLLASASSQTIDQAAQIILNELAANEQPQKTRFANGVSTFETVFDDTTSGSSVYSELAKLAQSELSYIYVRADRTTGETLVVENRNQRFQTGGYLWNTNTSQDTGGALLLETGDYLLLETGDKLLLDNTFTTTSQVSKSNAECGFLLLETGDYLLLENGDKLIINETQAADITADDIQREQGFQLNYFDNAYNSVRVSLQQKEVGADPVVLWSAEKAIAIGANETLEPIRGRYRDVSGGKSYINGSDIITPVSGTDYKMWSTSAGGGTDLSASLTIVADAGAAETEFTLTNTSGTAGYITNPKLQIRGTPIYNYDSLDFVIEDENGTGRNRFELNLHYETDSTIGQQYAQDIVRNPSGTITIQRLPLWVNKDTFNMNLFMDLDISSLVSVTETITGVENDSPYFINGYNFTIFKGIDGKANIRWFPNGFPYSRVYIPPT